MNWAMRWWTWLTRGSGDAPVDAAAVRRVAYLASDGGPVAPEPCVRVWGADPAVHRGGVVAPVSGEEAPDPRLVMTVAYLKSMMDEGRLNAGTWVFARIIPIVGSDSDVVWVVLNGPN